MMLRTIRRQQLLAMHHRNSFAQQRKRPTAHTRSSSLPPGYSTVTRHITLKDAMDYPITKSGGHRLLHPLGVTNEAAQDIVRNRSDEERWRRRMKVRTSVKSGRRGRRRRMSSPKVERARDAPSDLRAVLSPPRQNWFEKKVEGINDFVFEEPFGYAAEGRTSKSLDELDNCDLKYEALKNTRFKYYLTRRTIEKQPELLVNDEPLIHVTEDPNGNRKGKALPSPGAYSLYAHDYMVQKKFDERREQMAPAVTMEMMADQPSLLSAKNVFSFDKSEIRQLMARSDEDDILSQALLYDARYDGSWKRLTNLSGEERRKLKNRSGWVRPLSRICEKIGLDGTFFTKNRKVTLAEARNFVLYQRLTTTQGPSEWLSINDECVRNRRVDDFFENEWDGKAIQRRMVYYLKYTENDRDRLPIDGQYYNNIYLGKRMYGPGRKQKVVRTMIGGMEHRFEILDNPVNRTFFTHDAFDKNLHKCRNRRVKCRDNTRVVLRYPEGCEDDFIHANYVKGGPLFNQFIVTQAPMDNTVGDFWRMVWQEQSPYIFMLTSRKEKQRCARYWPRTAGSSFTFYGLKIYNEGIDDYRYPLFRVTLLRIVGPEDRELRVEHWQADFNNSDNLAAPLQLLHLARNCSKPTIVHCHLGISRSAVLVAIEICISALLKGPSYKHLVQKAVHLLRTQRCFSVETPIQYIYIHRVLQYFMQPMVGDLYDFRLEYKRWLDERAQRPFLDEIGQQIPGYRALSPPIDADLVARARHGDKTDYRREVPDSVGQLPIRLEGSRTLNEELKLSKKYPRGLRYQ